MLIFMPKLAHENAIARVQEREVYIFIFFCLCIFNLFYLTKIYVYEKIRNRTT